MENRVINRWKKSLYKKLLNYRIATPYIIVLMDGGVCSQMHQYLLGQLYVKRGYKVLYDLSFYKEWGTDLNLQYVRNFDLLKAFPYLPFKEAPRWLISLYKKKFYHEGNNTGVKIDNFSFLHYMPPVYLGGYYHLPSIIWLEAFRRLFDIRLEVLDAPNHLIFDEIHKKKDTVAVHVRRGDLKIERFDYGKPASEEYFNRAILYLKQKLSTPYFYFFSDEPMWVTETLIPQLQIDNQYCVININGSDKGYMDLLLIACCKHQITSKGTLGKYGAILQDTPQKIVVLCDDDIEYSWKSLFYNPVFL